MSKVQNVTFDLFKRDKEAVTERDTLARARPSYGGDVTVSRRDSRRDTWERDSDRARRARSITVTQGDTENRGKGNWLQVQALNLIDDAAHGIEVDPGQLARAHALLADLGPLRSSTADLVIAAARRVQAEVDSGAKVDPMRAQWARAVLLNDADPARARFEEGGA